MFIQRRRSLYFSFCSIELNKVLVYQKYMEPNNSETQCLVYFYQSVQKQNLKEKILFLGWGGADLGNWGKT